MPSSDPDSVLDRLDAERDPNAHLERIDFGPSRGLDRRRLDRLARTDWVANRQLVVVCGPPGVGKTFVACALAAGARGGGRAVTYARLSPLLQELAAARGAGDAGALLHRLARLELLVVDEWGLVPLSATELRDLVDLLGARRGRRATVLVSHLPVEAWFDFIGDPALAAAFVDRIGRGDHLIALRGSSRRPRRPITAGPSPRGPLRARLLPA